MAGRRPHPAHRRTPRPSGTAHGRRAWPQRHGDARSRCDRHRLRRQTRQLRTPPRSGDEPGFAFHQPGGVPRPQRCRAHQPARDHHDERACRLFRPGQRAQLPALPRELHGPVVAGRPALRTLHLTARRADPGVDKPDRLEASVLTVNYDPGRGVKYAGSGLVVVGIFTMFYMRAYFFGPRRSGHVPQPA
ncbi:MAG: hypothetical protein EBR86_04065 [Planctomycetia bacterium]|nr:hypothetical protein [Planctomycetia bacterium]